MVVIYICIGGALVAIIVLAALQMSRRPGPGERPASETDGGSDERTPGSGGLDPDDEKVAFSDRRRYPASRWDPTSEDEDVIDEDDRPAADRPRRPANRWESD
jgi:hypothetical protein